MKIEVRFFGMLADVSGKETMIVDDVKDTSELKKMLMGLWPGMAGQTFAIAIGNKICSGDQSLQDGDCVALLPPFAGG